MHESLPERTPVIVGAGQFTERLGSPDYQAMSSVQIAAAAARAAIADAGLGADTCGAIEAIFTTRTFEDSSPRLAQPFGKSDNFPRSIAQHLMISPRLAVWGNAGGNSPQSLSNEIFNRVAAGEFGMALLVGAENISSARHLQAAGRTADWTETVDAPVENRGPGLKGLTTQYAIAHQLVAAAPRYALAENARRKRMGLSREDYACQMAQLFAPMTTVAAANWFSSADISAQTAEELLTLGPRNRMIAEPYPQRLMARDQVNQGAAILICSVDMARSLGIPEQQWVFMHGHADMVEREMMEREDLGSSPAAQVAVLNALRAAEVTAGQIGHFDFYSCFPIAVSNVACDLLGMAADDPRGMTVTGGLPYFGGPGNNYSLHAIASMVERLRQHPQDYGLIGANGGCLSKYAVGIYSMRPKPWVSRSDATDQAALDAALAPTLALTADGRARVETYTVVYEKGEPRHAIVVGRLWDTGHRFLALSEAGDAVTLKCMLSQDPLGAEIFVAATGKGNRFAFTAERLAQVLPSRPEALRSAYEFVRVERRGALLEVTINRPDVRNCLHPMANDELAEVFDVFEADCTLYMAILTGAGTDAFCTGNDLKYTSSGQPHWTPLSGYAGLTNRVRTKPVIAAVNGYAMGGGMEIALACDIVVADANAQFALSEVRVGVIANAGGLVRLPRHLPKKIAVEYILTGRKMDVDTASRHGLVNRIMPPGQALQGARAIAQEILEASPTSVRLSMRAINGAEQHASENAAMRNRDPRLIDELITSEDFTEGALAFAQKRKPRWKNR